MNQLNKKGVFCFLAITFGLTIFVTILLWLNGFSLIGKPPLFAQFSIMGAMFIPGLSALIVRKFITKEGFADAGLKFGNWKLYLKTLIFVPILFVGAYGLTTIFIAKPDFSLSIFAQEYGLTIPVPPWQIIIGVIFGSLTFGPLVNSIPAFGEEFGWRGYLLPKLLPLGRTKALIISGIIWGLWHAPFVLLGMHYFDQRILGAIMFTLFVMLLGIYIGYLRLISGSTFLASFAHGLFNAQFYGVWLAIFPNTSPFFGGMTGLTGMFIFLIVAVWILRKKEFAAKGQNQEYEKKN